MRLLLRLIVLALAGYGAYALLSEYRDRLPGLGGGATEPEFEMIVEEIDIEITEPPATPSTLG